MLTDKSHDRQGTVLAATAPLHAIAAQPLDIAVIDIQRPTDTDEAIGGRSRFAETAPALGRRIAGGLAARVGPYPTRLPTDGADVALTRAAGVRTALDWEVIAQLFGLGVANVLSISCGLFAD